MSFYSPIFPYVDETVRANGRGTVNLECRDADPIAIAMTRGTTRRPDSAVSRRPRRFAFGSHDAWLRPVRFREPHEPP